jgi:predicted RNase H-like nuclease
LKAKKIKQRNALAMDLSTLAPITIRRKGKGKDRDRDPLGRKVTAALLSAYFSLPSNLRLYKTSAAFIAATEVEGSV